jgi:hypothetical protein
MRLDEFVEGLDRDDSVRRRQLAKEKSYAITDYLDEVEREFESATSGDTLFGSTSPSIFVGRSGYPEVSTGVLAPVVDADRAERFETSSEWYHDEFSIDDVFRHRSNLVNSSRRADVRVADEWDGFVGVNREVAIADRPVDVEVDFDGTPSLFEDGGDVATPTGPRVTATDARLGENPYVPRRTEKVLEDDDWNATGAMTYLYRRGYDVYDINTILSGGALGRTEQRRLVPTRWSITAVDDTVGQFLRGRIRNATSVDETLVWYNEYVGNHYWIIATPGQWEFELVELKGAGSVWNPGGDAAWIASDHEGREGRTDYADETTGAYYAARLGVLEHLADIDRQATVLVLRHVTADYWGPVGVWQIRESVRNAFDDEPARAESLGDAVSQIVPQLPISSDRLRRNATLAAGQQATLSGFGTDGA